MANKNILIRKKNGTEWDTLYPVTTATNVKTGDGKTVETKLTEAATKVTNTVTLKATGWINKTQTINLSTIKATSLLWVTPVPASLKAYSEAMIFASSQSAGTITFVCDDIPTVDLDVTIVNGGDV